MTPWKDPTIEPPPFRRILMIYTTTGQIATAMFRTREDGRLYYTSDNRNIDPGRILAYIPAPDVPDWAKKTA
jgi:hypothetical protein